MKQSILLIVIANWLAAFVPASGQQLPIKPIIPTGYFQERSCYMVAEFVLKDTVTGTTYVLAGENKPYFKQWLYLVPVYNQGILVQENMFMPPRFDSLTLFYKTNYNLVPILKSARFYTATGKNEITFSNSADTIYSSTGRYLWYKYPSGLGKLSYDLTPTLPDSVYKKQWWIVTPNGSSLETATIRAELAKIKRVNIFDDRLVFINKNPFLSGYLLHENFVQDTIHALLAGVFDNIGYPLLKTHTPKVSVDCNLVKDTIHLSDAGIIKRYQVACKYGYIKNGKPVVPAVFDRALPFGTNKKSENYKKTYAFIGKERFVLRRNCKKWRKG